MNLTVDNIDKSRNHLPLLMAQQVRATGRLDQQLALLPDKAVEFLVVYNAAALLLAGTSVELLMYVHTPSFSGRNQKLIYNRTGSHQNPPQSHSQDGPIAKTTTDPLTAATAAVAMEDDLIHTYPDTTAITTITPITIAATITETASIITSTTALVRVMAGRRIADTVTEVTIPIPTMPEDEVKVRR